MRIVRKGSREHMSDPHHRDHRPASRRDVLKLGVFLGAGLAAGAMQAWPASAASVAGSRRGSVLPRIAGAPGPGEIDGVRGGTVTTVWSDRPMSFDPAIGWDSASWEAMTQLLFTPLLQFEGQSGGPAPSAAAALPELSADGTVMTIRLRPGVKFHNGREVVAEDYRYSWTRVLTADLASWASSYLMGIVGAQEYYDGAADAVSGIEVIDDHTLRVTLAAPDIMFNGLLCQPYMSAVPKEVIDEIGDSAFALQPVGTGPFRADGWNETDRRASFVRFDDYFWEGTPLLDGVIYRWGITSELQVLQLLGGVGDFTGYGLTPNQTALLRSRGEEGKKLIASVKANAVQWVALNSSRGPLKDARVRRALSLATDRAALARVGAGTTTAWSLPFPPDLPGYTSATKQVELDREEARRLLKEAGHPRLSLEFLQAGDGPWPNNAQILQQQWQEIGVETTITTMGKAAFDWATYNQQGDAYGMRWYSGQPSGLDIVTACFVTGASTNYTGYSNAEVDELAALARTASTVAESNALLAQIERILVEDAAGIFIAAMNYVAARSTRLQNFQYRGEYGLYYDRLSIEEDAR
jgi:peptide/nickel transport system substrate-binding protein